MGGAREIHSAGGFKPARKLPLDTGAPNDKQTQDIHSHSSPDPTHRVDASTTAGTKAPSCLERTRGRLTDVLLKARSHLPVITAGVGTLDSGCRGFIGPVPPPLWIRVRLLYSVVVMGAILASRLAFVNRFSDQFERKLRRRSDALDKRRVIVYSYRVNDYTADRPSSNQRPEST